MYEKRNTIRKNLTYLDKIAQSYNRVQRLANQVEIGLLQPNIDSVDGIILEGENDIKWENEDRIWPFIEKLLPPIQELENKLNSSQDNVKAIKKLVGQWVSHPLFERRDGRKDQQLNLDDLAQERKHKRYKEIQESSEKLKELVQANKDLLKDGTVPDSAWSEYLNYVDNIVLDGMVKAVAVSFGYLVDHTDHSLTPSPLMEVKMELNETELVS